MYAQQHSSQQYELESARHYETLLLQYGHNEHPAAPIASTSALPAPPASAPLLQNNATAGGGSTSSALSFAQNLTQQAQQSLQQQSQMQIPGMRPPVLDVQDPLALQWSLAHLSSLIRKALRSIQGEDDISSSDDSSEDVDAVSSSSSDNDDGKEDQQQEEGAGDTYRARASPAAQQALTSSAKTASSEAISVASSSSQQQDSNQQQHHHHHHHHRNSTSKHDEGEGGYLRLLLNAGFDKSSAALERNIELERLKKENEALREMLGVASDLPPNPTPASASTMALSPSSTSSQ